MGGRCRCDFFSRLPKLTRAALSLLLASQCLLIYWLLPYDPRFLGGLQFGLLITFAAFVTPHIQDRFASARYMLLSSTLLLLPWLGIQIYYAKQFFPVALGLEKRPFYERYVAFYKDYIQLNRLLSNDTVILVQGFRLSAVYAPRPIFFDPADLPKGKRVVLFSPPDLDPETSLGDYKRGKVIYTDSAAIIETYRTPGRESIIGPLEVCNSSGVARKRQFENACQSDFLKGQSQLPRLSVVIPSYNEGATLSSVIRLVLAQSEVQEVIVVDDGSQDQTWEMLQPLCDEDPRVIALCHSQNRGKGAALRTGFAKASADIILVQDADLEYDPLEYPLLIRPILDGKADVVFGSRFLGGGRAPSSLFLAFRRQQTHYDVFKYLH